METRVSLYCPDCPPRHRTFGELDFPNGLPALMIVTCTRGHKLGVRPLSRDERRKYEKRESQPAPSFVATRWETTE